MTADEFPNVYKVGPSIPVSISRLREGCTWCGESLEHAEEFTIIGFTEYTHGRLPNDCPSDPRPTSDELMRAALGKLLDRVEDDPS